MSFEFETSTVLTIDDNPANTDLIMRVLGRRSDLKLISASRGAEGLALARDHLPDVVLLDLHLPDMSGHEVLLALRADPTLRHVPVIIVTADASTAKSELLMKDGAFRYITKPFDLLELMAAVDAAVAERRRLAAAEGDGTAL